MRREMCRELCTCSDILRLCPFVPRLDGRHLGHLGHFRADRGAAGVRAVVVGADIGGGLLVAGPEPPDGRFRVCFSFLERVSDVDVLFAECSVVVCEEVAALGGWTLDRADVWFVEFVAAIVLTVFPSH